MYVGVGVFIVLVVVVVRWLQRSRHSGFVTVSFSRFSDTSFPSVCVRCRGDSCLQELGMRSRSPRHYVTGGYTWRDSSPGCRIRVSVRFSRDSKVFPILRDEISHVIRKDYKVTRRGRLSQFACNKYLFCLLGWPREDGWFLFLRDFLSGCILVRNKQI